MKVWRCARSVDSCGGPHELLCPEHWTRGARGVAFAAIDRAAFLKDELSTDTGDDSFALETESQPGAGRRLLAWLRTWKGVVALVVLVVGATALFNARTLYDAAKSWRADRLIARSEAAGKRGDEAEEFRLLRQAYVLFPAKPLTLRAVARYHEKRGEGAAMQLYEKLLETPDATDEDSIRACRVALQGGNAELGRKLLGEMRRKEELRQRPEVLTLEAQLLAMDGSWEAALAMARKAAAQKPEHAAEDFVLASLLVRAAERAPAAAQTRMRAEAIDLLANLVTSPEQAGLEAIGALVALARQPAAAALLAERQVGAWVEAAARHPKANPKLRIAAWDLRVAAKPADAETIAREFLAKWRDAAEEEQLEAARWLIQRGRPALSLELSTPRLDASAAWLLVHLDALAATNRWDTVLERLQNPAGQAAKLQGTLRALFAMRARTELRQPFDRAEAWRDIQILARNETVHDQLYVAQYAGRTGEREQAAVIYRRLLDRPGPASTFDTGLSAEEKMTCHSGLIRAASATAPAAEVLPLLEAMSADFPAMEEAANDAIYLRLLTGDFNEAMAARLRPLLEKNPALLAYRTTLALCELRAGHAVAAAKLYEGWQIDWTTAPDRFKAVRVAILEANGRADEAQTLRAMIDPKMLRPEEAALLGK